MNTGSQFVMEGVKNLVLKQHNIPVTRILDNLMEMKSHPETDDYRYFDPKMLRGSESSIPRNKNPFQEAVVFVVGGGNYIEYQNLVDYAKSKQGKKVIYGCSELFNAAQFIKQLSQLGQKCMLGAGQLEFLTAATCPACRPVTRATLISALPPTGPFFFFIIFISTAFGSESSVAYPVTCETRGADLTEDVVVVLCPPGCSQGQMSVFGTGIYASVSSVCGAALHRGALRAAGGPIRVHKLQGRNDYLSSYAHGIQSQPLTQWSSSFSLTNRNDLYLCYRYDQRLLNTELQKENAALKQRLDKHSERYGEASPKLDEGTLANLLQAAESEKAKLQTEVSRLTKALENFDPSFFEELEDLKYNYNVEVKKNILLERELRKVCGQFGVEVQMPHVSIS
ncbi:Sec1 family domain-containing 1 [Solea senegalensis]|uniref:Sec1 family domain-containing 1 n=1 Tax=Solea senegalensis TaxID=28829 RepID=A0AAV6T106_SOLSE|nr:Sec1 family domain-containing 1 [Solea senegalensis]